MDEVIKSIEKLCRSDTKTKNLQKFYKVFNECKINNKIEENCLYECLLPKIYTLFDEGVLQKDIFYLSLIANNNNDLLEKCNKYDKKVFQLNICDSISLYNNCIYKNTHWFNDILYNYESFKSKFDDNIANKISTLKCIEFSNSLDIDVDQLKFLIANVRIDNLEEFWIYYLKELTNLIEIFEFCQKSSTTVKASSIFDYGSKNCILETLSKFVDLDKCNCDEILQKINKNESVGNKIQTEIFTGFTILCNILKLIVPLQNNEFFIKTQLNTAVTDIKLKLLNIETTALQMELLENIFAMIFFKNNHLIKEIPTSVDYICKEKEIRLILYLLKTVLDEVKLKNIYNKDCKEYNRFMDLNKFVTEATWRLELIINIKSSQKCEINLLQYMLAQPESLILMCLKEGDFERAYQVIEIFNLNNLSIASEIKYSESIRHFQESLRKTFKIKAIHKENPNISVSNVDLSINKSVEDFFKCNPIHVNEENEKIISLFEAQHPFLNHFKTDNETFMNMLDLAITQPKNSEDCGILLQLAFENDTLENNIKSDYATFSKKLLDLFNEVGTKNNFSVSEMLTHQNVNFDLVKYKKEEEFYENLSVIYDEFCGNLKSIEPGVLNNNHSTHKSLLKINKLCNEFVEWNLGSNENTKYLSKLFNYLKAFSKVLFIEQNTSDLISKGKNTSYFELLNYNRSELMGKLLFERHLDPSEFEKYFGKLKLDYLYHVIGNCFPTINLHTKENVAKDELYHENNLYTPSKGIITYIQKRNWLLAFVLNKMYNVEGVNIDISEVRIQALTNYLKLPKIQHLQVIYDDNSIVTALQNDINCQTVVDYVNKQILKHENLQLTTSYNSNISMESLETGEEILEDAIKSPNWKALYDIIDSIPEKQMKKNSDFLEVKDLVLINLVQDGFEIDYYKYVQFISDTELRIRTILGNFRKWPGEFCINLLKCEITKFEITPASKTHEVAEWLQQIELCEELNKILEVKTWAKSYDICKNNPQEIISKLLLRDNIEILLQFIDLHKPSEELLERVTEHYIVKIFETHLPLISVKYLLDRLPYDHSIRICYSLLTLLKKLQHLQFVIDYLLNNVIDDNLHSIEISLKMLSVFSQNEQEQLLCLIHEPLNIVEILIMNTKLEKLTIALNIFKSEMANVEPEQSLLAMEKIDELLRNYAEKSLDFRVITQPNPRLLRTPDYKLMQSLDSLNLGSDCKTFVMPEEVPVKEEWIQNDEVLECMCCQQITFSMFNRRHHCRRCGRVVCYNCSMKRMRVSTYGDILVRVCANCYEQTYGDSCASDMNDTTSTKSIVYDYWVLSDDPEHNDIVREEFSYEHAPSVSLCLSIMKYHSRSVEYPKFLLDQCDIMIKLLQPSQEPIQEIDYLLVIKMLKSLAIAAKMSSVECNLNYGTSLAERILSQAELLGLLAERGCLNLLPVSSHTQGPYIDSSVLRILRNKLLEREQWNLALEVSTKAGLESSGVFAAWGKSCLKAGSLMMAREKFQRCLDKTGHYENVSDYTISSEVDESSGSHGRSRYLSRMSNLSAVSETKPTKNPPLLNEIILIIESKTKPIDSNVLKQVQNQKLSGSMVSLNQSFTLSIQPDTSICILNKLNNLKSISAGNYYDCAKKIKRKPYAYKPTIHKVFYDECIYYITKYGTHLSLLEFYVKHGEIDKALSYIIDNRLTSDVFIDIYMKCLKDGIINHLQENMSKADSTLDIWKDYLRQICRHLEKQNMLHSLYQLQQFMGDYIRAAMTCIRFYQENVKNFTDFAGKVSFLQTAEEHLKQVLEQEQWVEVASVSKMTTSQDGFEEKGIINPSLVMKINPNDIDKHINTIWRQNETAKFLSECESFGVQPMEILPNILPKDDSPVISEPQAIKVPTLFGTTMEKMCLSVLAIISGKNVEDGFGVALGIIEEFKLKPVKIYCEAGKQLANAVRYDGIAQLVNCIKQSGTKDNIITDMCDEMLTLAVATFTKANVSGTKVEDLIKLISDRATKINAYIEVKQLKTAYFLAVKYKRMSDIRRILREAELLNQPSIKALCQKVLQSQSHAPSYSKE